MPDKPNAADSPSEMNAVPGTHRDASDQAQHFMRSIIEACVSAWPGTQVAVFITEPDGDRFNYGSNCKRTDLIAMVRACADRLEEDMGRLKSPNQS
jgi:hypothetical protein